MDKTGGEPTGYDRVPVSLKMDGSGEKSQDNRWWFNMESRPPSLSSFDPSVKLPFETDNANLLLNDDEVQDYETFLDNLNEESFLIDPIVPDHIPTFTDEEIMHLSESIASPRPPGQQYTLDNPVFRAVNNPGVRTVNNPSLPQNNFQPISGHTEGFQAGDADFLEPFLDETYDFTTLVSDDLRLRLLEVFRMAREKSINNYDDQSQKISWGSDTKFADTYAAPTNSNPVLGPSVPQFQRSTSWVEQQLSLYSLNSRPGQVSHPIQQVPPSSSQPSQTENVPPTLLPPSTRVMTPSMQPLNSFYNYGYANSHKGFPEIKNSASNGNDHTEFNLSGSNTPLASIPTTKTSNNQSIQKKKARLSVRGAVSKSNSSISRSHQQENISSEAYLNLADSKSTPTEESLSLQTKDAPRKNRKQTYLSEEQKRENHINSEQRRRNVIKDGFQTLHRLVPALQRRSESKGIALASTLSYLRKLKSGNERLRTIIRNL